MIPVRAWHPFADGMGAPFTWSKAGRVRVAIELFDPLITDDLVDEVVYVAARLTTQCFLVYTESPQRALDWMCSSEVRWQLVQRTKNLWWGCGAGTQALADLRVPVMLKWPVAHRWLSLKPLMESVNLRRWLRHEFSANPRTGFCEDCKLPKSDQIHSKHADIALASDRPRPPFCLLDIEPLSRLGAEKKQWHRFACSQAEFAGIQEYPQ